MKKLNLKFEYLIFIFIYIALFALAIYRHDSPIALFSALCGITYTILAGKGIPICYPIGTTGSAFYSYLAFKGHLWGNMLLYMCYYIPMQILGFFKWNKNLKSDKYEIIKTSLPKNERIKLGLITLFVSIITAFILAFSGDKSPVIDSITTIFSILGMYLTVRRAIEQWVIWMLVNGLSCLMWLDIALKGGRVYSTVFMWGVYFFLAIYFYYIWKRELSANSTKQENALPKE